MVPSEGGERRRVRARRAFTPIRSDGDGAIAIVVIRRR